jgi:hypothetical protein
LVPSLEVQGVTKEVLAALFPPGSERFGGCWDYREDLEGMTYGSLADMENAWEKAHTVAEERSRHLQTRYELFYGDGDSVEPLGTEDVQPFDWRPV